MKNIVDLKNLLHHVAIIQKKYEDIAAVTGENFNIFSILKVDSSEVRMHSAFISELLNPKGVHGLKSVPLKLFVDLIEYKFSQDNNDISDLDLKFNVDADSAKIFIEKHIGFINNDVTEGGRIDILVQDKSNKGFMIENKIYAGDQENQLVRYHNAHPNIPILYLTLNGNAPNSHGNLIENINYFVLSYKEDVKKWLELCIKEAVHLPMLREVIKQYIYLIKKLTNQTINIEMSEEIIDVMSTNINAAFEIEKNIRDLKKQIFVQFQESLKNTLANVCNVKPNNRLGSIHHIIQLEKTEWNGITIQIYFNGDDFTNALIGVKHDKFDVETRRLFDKQKFANIYGKDETPKSKNWYKIYHYNKLRNTKSADFWVKLNDGDFISSVIDDLKNFIEATNQVAAEL